MTMAKVICNIGNCKHRLKKPLRTYKRRDGKKCYGCELHAISVSLKFDPDRDICIASCDDYEPVEEDGHAARQFVHKAYEPYSVRDGDADDGSGVI